ncbi:MAG: hypothetical protein WBB30_02685 [Solirubrobacterales bacterium]
MLALGAAQPGKLDRMLASGARGLGQPAQTQRRRFHFKFTLLRVGEKLGWPEDRVDDRADEREQRSGGRGGDQNRIIDPATGIGVGPPDQGDPNDYENQDQQVDHEVQRAVGYSEKGSKHRVKRVSLLGSRRRAAPRRAAGSP